MSRNLAKQRMLQELAEIIALNSEVIFISLYIFTSLITDHMFVLSIS